MNIYKGTFILVCGAFQKCFSIFRNWRRYTTAAADNKSLSLLFTYLYTPIAINVDMYFNVDVGDSIFADVATLTHL